MAYAVIAENDESQWHDVTGVSYHFPRKHKRLLRPGTRVVYYKGVLRKAAFRAKRMTDAAHYFATATIGQVYPDTTSTKGDMFAEILEFRRFSRPVDIRHEGEFIESVPEDRRFYWRDGVRPVAEETYHLVISLGEVPEVGNPEMQPVTDAQQELPETLVTATEGGQSLRLVSVYERDPKLREEAIRIHGTTCIACGLNFAEVYGQHGAGYIHVHHLQPLAEEPGERLVDPAKDMTVLCANCHAMVHRFRNRTLTLEELNSLLRARD